MLTQFLRDIAKKMAMKNSARQHPATRNMPRLPSWPIGRSQKNAATVPTKRSHGKSTRITACPKTDAEEVFLTSGVVCDDFI